MPSSVPRTFVRLAGVPVGMSVTLMPGTLVQISCTTELPVFKTVMFRTDAPTPNGIAGGEGDLKIAGQGRHAGDDAVGGVESQPRRQAVGGETQRRVGARNGETERLAEERHRAQGAGHDRRRVGAAGDRRCWSDTDRCWE